MFGNNCWTPGQFRGSMQPWESRGKGTFWEQEQLLLNRFLIFQTRPHWQSWHRFLCYLPYFCPLWSPRGGGWVRMAPRFSLKPFFGVLWPAGSLCSRDSDSLPLLNFCPHRARGTFSCPTRKPTSERRPTSSQTAGMKPLPQTLVTWGIWTSVGAVLWVECLRMLLSFLF